MWYFFWIQVFLFANVRLSNALLGVFRFLLLATIPMQYCFSFYVANHNLNNLIEKRGNTFHLLLISLFNNQ